jgi:putative ABC transport system permease protein
MNTAITTSGSSLSYKADDVMEKVRSLQKLSESTNQQLIWIAGISLLVGGIGVMNIMLVTVTERTKEIGLKKAIGARKKTILAQFLTEASVLTSVGGIIGVITGIGLSRIVSSVSGTPSAVSVPAIVGSVVFSTLIGVVFGLLPSVKAANLNPIDALRSE